MTVRRRKKSKADKHLSPKNKPGSSAAEPKVTQIHPSLDVATPHDLEETPSLHIITNHRFVQAFFFIGIPYLLYLLRLFLLLQNPEWIPSLLGEFRPAVDTDTERQLLIVGAMSSGTSQVTHELNERFGLEMGHEESDSTWKFVRDGTISWFHGIRFFGAASGNGNGGDNENYRVQMALKSCRFASQWIVYGTNPYGGYGPKLFGPPQFEVSHMHPNFSHYWFKECFRVLHAEFGCAARKDCRTPFRRTLIQAREPLKIVESLVAKYCRQKKGGDEEYHLPPASLIAFFDATFLDFSKKINSTETSFGSNAKAVCTNQLSNYVIIYYNQLLDAYNRGEIDGMYRIEASSVCDVAKLAGWTNNSTSVYGPHYEMIQDVCNPESKVGLIGKKKNVINQGRVKISLGDVGGKEMLKGMKKLYSRMGYDYPHS